jgi:hypothetical protein
VVPVRVSIKMDDLTSAAGGHTASATVFSSQVFDARSIDPKTVTLDGVPVLSNRRAGPDAWFENIGHAPVEDLSLRFDAARLKLHGRTRVVLEGKTYHGARVKGSAEATTILR